LVMLSLGRLNTYPAFVIGAGLIAFCFGGYLAIYPALVADLYGTRNIGVNYGVMYTAYGAGALVGPWLQSRLVEKCATLGLMSGGVSTSSFDVIDYGNAFLVSGGLCVLAVISAWAARIRVPCRDLGPAIAEADLSK